jgi:hypothetical protein
MLASHARSAVSASFDDPNLVSCAGLEPVMVLAEACGLAGLVADRLSVPSPNARLKVPALVAGMVAGADSTDDMDLLRHGGMGRLFDGVRAPSTLGTFLTRPHLRSCAPARLGRRGHAHRAGRAHAVAERGRSDRVPRYR